MFKQMSFKLALFVSVCGVLLFATIPVEAQPEWESAIGGFRLETAHEIKEIKSTLDPMFENGVLAVGGTATWGESFSPNPPNLYVTMTDKNGLSAQAFVFELNAWEEDYGIVELDNGDGFVVTTGIWNEHTGSFDIAVIRYDYVIGFRWLRMFGGSGRDGGTGILQKGSGNYAGHLMVSGIYETISGDLDGCLLVLDVNGNLIDGRRYGVSTRERFYGIAQGDPTEPSFNDVVFLVGSSSANGGSITDEDIWYAVADLSQPNFPLINSVLYDMGSSQKNDYGYDLIISVDGSVGPGEWRTTIVGTTFTPSDPSFIQAEAVVLRVGIDGSTTVPNSWLNRYNIPYFAGDDGWDVAYALVQDILDFNSVVVVGQTNVHFDQNGSGFAMRLDANGVPALASLYGRHGYDTFRSIATKEANTPEAGLYFGGTTLSAGTGGGDQWLALANSSLGTGTNAQTHQACAEIVAPTYASGAAVLNVTFWNQGITQVAHPDFLIENGGDVVRICEGSGGPVMIVTDVEEDPRADADQADPAQVGTLMQISPNPIQSGSEVKVTLVETMAEHMIVNVYDVRGSLIATYAGAQFAGVNELAISTTGWTPGAYSISINNGETVERQSVMIID